MKTLLTIYALASVMAAQTVTTLASFDVSNGSAPVGAIALGSDGYLYGTTSQGGAYVSSLCGGSSCGTIYKMSPSGILSTLHSFNGTDGYLPYSSLLQASDGYFYGTTVYGGLGYGTIFRISSAGDFSIFYAFHGTDGYAPFSGVVQDSQGNFYGTTFVGGSFQEGTFYKITPSAVLTTMYSFSFSSNGANPVSTPVIGTNGNFYGTTNDYGLHTGSGVIYEITPSGAYTVLARMSAASGTVPCGQLVRASSGQFYGIANSGGATDDGTVYKITSSGLTTVYNFSLNAVETAGCSNMVQLGSGVMLGVTYIGGSHGDGMIFSINPAGAFHDLYDFSGPDGRNPESLTPGGGGFYGVTYAGGAYGDGSVFKLSF